MARPRYRDGLRKAAQYLGLRLIQYAVAFLIGIVVSRALGPAGRAGYAVPTALATVVWGISHLSLDTASGRLLARREADIASLTSFLSTACLLLSVVAVAAMLALGLGPGAGLVAGASTSAVVIAAFTIPGLLVFQVSGYLLFLAGSLRPYGLVAAASAVLQLGMVLALALTGLLTPESALLANAVSSTAAAAGTVAALTSHTGAAVLLPRLDWALGRQLVITGISLHPGATALQLAARFDLLIVAALTDPVRAGLYSLALALANSVFLVNWTVAQTALETQTHADQEEAVRYTLEFTRQTLMLGCVFLPVAAALAYPVIPLVYGGEFRASILPFVILSSAGLAITLETPVRTMLVRIVRPVTISMLAISGMGLSIGLNFMFIPWLGLPGAALASAIAFWFYALAMLILLRRATGVHIGRVFQRPRRGDLVVDLVYRAALKLRAVS